MKDGLPLIHHSAFIVHHFIMLTIVFLERDTLKADLRRPVFEHVWRDYGATRPEEVL